MDALTKSFAILLVLTLSLLCCVSESDGSGDLDGLLLFEVNPKTCEGVAVHNYGSRAVDLVDYTVGDRDSVTGSKEGLITFTKSVIVRPGETVVIASSYDSENVFCSQDGVTLLIFGENGVTKKGSFALNNNGDDVYLFQGDTIIDAVAYGTGTASADFWYGDAVSVSGDKFIVRTGETDTDTAADWSVYGVSNLFFDPDLQFNASVTPFLFPESGGIPIYRALESAKTSIWINMYELRSTNILSLLCVKAEQGVSVRLLLEGDSLSSTSDPIIATSPYLMTIVSLGGEVRIIGGSDSDRYTYDHAKYAIVDADTVIVTSENWTADNMNGSADSDPYDALTDGNRGWGAIISSGEYAEYMISVYENDFTLAYGDVTPFEELYPYSKTTAYSYSAPETVSFPSYDAKVTPVLSPDNSYEALQYYASSAVTRLYSEQQSLGSSYTGLEDDSPVTLFASAVQRGVDVRLLFGTSVDSETVLKINLSTGIEAAIMNSPYLHNKGVIADDAVWISSVNWTNGSFSKNREVCAVIVSKEIADFFAESFLSDFSAYYAYGGFDVELSGMKAAYDSGEEMIVYAIPSVSGTFLYQWDKGDGSETVVTENGFIVFRPADGDHVLTVTVTDSEGNEGSASWKYSVGESIGYSVLPEGELDNYLYMLPLAVLILLTISIAMKQSRADRGMRRRR